MFHTCNYNALNNAAWLIHERYNPPDETPLNINTPRQGWTGQRCPDCKGSGECQDARACVSCGGTGDEHGDV